MKVDNLFVYALMHELSYLNEGVRIDKIHQPTQFDLVFHLRTSNGNKKILISCHPETFRIHETSQSFTNPKTPKIFCVVLRKYIEGGKIVRVEQLHSDRLLRFTIETYDSVGNYVTRYLIVELMGKHSNCILTDQDETIIDALKRVDISRNEYREILPKQRYIYPPVAKPMNDFIFFIQKPYRRWLEIHQYEPTVLALKAQQPQGFVYRKKVSDQYIVSFFAIDEIFAEEAIEKIVFPTLSQAFEYYFNRLTMKQQLHERLSSLLQFVERHYKKNIRKRDKLLVELQNAEGYDTFQQYGNLLLTHQHAFPLGEDTYCVPNYFAPNQDMVCIPIDGHSGATQNAQKYFKKYTKARNAIKMLQIQLEQTATEIVYFESILQGLEHADLEQAEDVRQELQQQGYLKQRKHEKKKVKVSDPLTFEYAGVQLLVGRNNLQNDYVTFKCKRRGYIWLHVKDFPGSHVLICTSNPPAELLQAGALLAAHFSKLQHSENIAVDYTEVQHVSKPTGAKPGFVIYKEQKTLYVTPSYDVLSQFFPTFQS